RPSTTSPAWWPDRSPVTQPTPDPPTAAAAAAGGAGGAPAPAAALGVEFSPRQAQTEQLVVSIVWMTSGLACHRHPLPLTPPPAASRPTVEDLRGRALPGMPGVALYNPVLAMESGDQFMRAWYDAAAGKLDPFILVLEGSVPNEEINGEGHWAALGVDPVTKD